MGEAGNCEKNRIVGRRNCGRNLGIVKKQYYERTENCEREWRIVGEMRNYKRNRIMEKKRELCKRQGMVGTLRNKIAALCKHKQL